MSTPQIQVVPPRDGFSACRLFIESQYIGCIGASDHTAVQSLLMANQIAEAVNERPTILAQRDAALKALAELLAAVEKSGAGYTIIPPAPRATARTVLASVEGGAK